MNRLLVGLGFSVMVAACGPSAGRTGHSGSVPEDTTTGGGTGLVFPDSGTSDKDGAELRDIHAVADGVAEDADGAADAAVAPDSSALPADTGSVEPDGGVDPGPAITGGGLVLELNSLEPVIHSATVTTRFRAGPTPAAAPVLVDGPCTVVSGDGSPLPDPAPGLDAGVVSYTGLSVPLSLQPVAGPNGVTYPSGLPESQEAIVAGPSVTLHATGGPDISAFSIEAQSPAPVLVNSPVAGGAVDKSNALNVVWNVGNGTHIRIDLFVYDGAKEKQLYGNSISCELVGGVGSYTVPAALMKMLPGGGKKGFPDFNFDYLVFGVSRIVLQELSLPNAQGTVSLAVTRTSGGIAKLEK